MLRISEQHGVNPTIPICFFCMEPKNEVVLLGKMRGDAKADMHMCINYEPCDECKNYMGIGVILVSVQDEDEGNPDPHRTGGWWVMSDDFITRLWGEESPALKSRFAFITESACRMIGLEKANEETIKAEEKTNDGHSYPRR